MALTRRGLLRAGLLGSVVVWAGGIVGCATRRAAVPLSAPRAALSPAGETIIRAVMPVVLGSLLPPDAPDRTAALDAGVSTLDEYLATLSPPLQAEAADVFETLDLFPVRVVLLGSTAGWEDAPPETVAAFLRAAQTSRLELLRRMYVFLQSMAVLAWFDQRCAWPAIGYPGPPLERAATFGGLT